MQNDIQVKQGLDAQAVMSIMLRHKLAVLLVFFTFTAIISYYSLSKPTLYRSSAVLYFENANNNPVLDLLGKNNNGSSLQTPDAGYYEIIITTDLFNRRFKEVLAQELKKYRDNSYVHSALHESSSKQLTLKPYKEAAQFIEVSAMSYDSFLVQKIVEVATNLLKTRTTELDQEGLQKGIQFIEEQIGLTQANLEKTEMELEALKKKTDIVSKDAEGPLSKMVVMKDKFAELETQIQIKASNFAALESQLDSIQQRMTGQNVKPDKESKEELRVKAQIEDLKNKKAALFEKLGVDAFENSEVKKIDDQMAELRNQYYALLSSVNLGNDKVIASDLNEVWKEVFTKKNEEEIELIILKGQAKLYAGLIRNFELKNPNLLQDAIDMTRLNRSKLVFEETLNSLIRQKENFSIQYYGTTGNLKIIDPARAPVSIYNKVFMNILIGSLVGLLIGIALAFGIEYLDNSIRNVESITALTNIPIIGKIPPIDVGEISNIANVGEQISEKLKFRKKKGGEPEDKNVVRKKAMISRFNARSFVSERYRTLRTNIQFTNIDTPMRSVLISSAGPGEGKTTTAVNLGISFSDMGHNVCLVDTDFRKPKHHLLFEISESPGLTDIVINNMDLDAAIQPTSIKNLSVLTVGSNAYNHSEIFSSMRMSILMNELEKRFEMVIYDTPPILLLTDSVILSSRVDGVLLVVKYAVTQKPFLLNAITALKAVRANIIGIVLNDFAGEHRNYYQYAYDSYYMHPSEKKEKVQ